MLLLIAVFFGRVFVLLLCAARLSDVVRVFGVCYVFGLLYCCAGVGVFGVMFFLLFVR